MLYLKIGSLISFSMAAIALTVTPVALPAANPDVQQQSTTEQAAPKQGGILDLFTQAKERITALTSQDPSISTLVQALKVANMSSILTNKGPVTIFAPNNAAFAKLPPDKLKSLLKPEGRTQLADILKFHIVQGKISPQNFKTSKVKTLNGKDLDLKVQGTEMTVNGAKVIKSESIGDNVQIYVIDQVLQP